MLLNKIVVLGIRESGADPIKCYGVQTEKASVYVLMNR